MELWFQQIRIRAKRGIHSCERISSLPPAAITYLLFVNYSSESNTLANCNLNENCTDAERKVILFELHWTLGIFQGHFLYQSYNNTLKCYQIRQRKYWNVLILFDRPKVASDNSNSWKPSSQYWFELKNSKIFSVTHFCYLFVQNIYKNHMFSYRGVYLFSLRKIAKCALYKNHMVSSLL